MANVLLFGPLADVLDTSSIEIELGDQTRTIHGLLSKLSDKGPE
ncbi:hypothetical protein MNBD_GAMMA21-925 [hydrothermal vent metagenome]|uniref:Molybdopterin synthase sulfur carrier subunit n=1 Tax=hydrothermal vent metagenome TaxID=652676 RepID=A0A3B1A408_9ZZZZ